jgi:hypothetical protein
MHMRISVVPGQLAYRSRSGSEVGQAHQLVVQLVGVIPRISRAGLPRLAGRELRITSAFHALVTDLNSVFTLGSQGADGGNRWLLMQIRGHLGGPGHGVPARGRSGLAGASRNARAARAR